MRWSVMSRSRSGWSRNASPARTTSRAAEPSWRSARHNSGGADLDLVVTLEAIDGEGAKPARHEDADDGIAEHVPVVVQDPNGIPECPLQAEVFGDEPQRLDPADAYGDD